MFIHYLITSILTFAVFWLDKRAAVAGLQRVPEITLWVLCASGGLWGGWIAMFVFRHKIKKVSFCIVMGLISAMHIFFLAV